MMFYKPIVSFLAGLAVAGSVSAATTPGDTLDANGDLQLQHSRTNKAAGISPGQCDSGSLQCCEDYLPPDDPLVYATNKVIAELQFCLTQDVSDWSTLGVGLYCSMTDGTQCQDILSCCKEDFTDAYGTVSFGCTIAE